MKHILASAAIVALQTMLSEAAPTSQPSYTNVETRYASPQAIKLFDGFFAAKTAGDGPKWVSYFNPTQAAYYDSTLGSTIAANRSELVQKLGSRTPGANVTGARSYPLRILGDTKGGAVVYFVDSPAFFGAEIRTITSFDFVNGTIIRQLDNWDGRNNSVKSVFPPDPTYPTFGLKGLQETSATQMKTVVTRLNDAFSAGNATAVANLFSIDGVFEDLVLRARVDGRIAITAYLQRVIKGLPYGPGTAVTHVLGSAQGGGYEWRPRGNGVLYGISALELDPSGKISRFTATWDGSRLSQSTLQGLAKQAPTP